ncbi:MAG: hypothetical protein ACKO0M_06020 [Cyanobium sp.]
MSKPVPWFWIVLAALLLLLPMPAGRLLLDLLGGLTLTLLLLPLLAGAAAWIGWQVLRSRLRACPSCGVSSFASEVCPACGCSMQGGLNTGSPLAFEDIPIDAAHMTINVEAIEVDGSGSGSTTPTSGD